jgi:hypothetical protein
MTSHRSLTTLTFYTLGLKKRKDLPCLYESGSRANGSTQGGDMHLDSSYPRQPTLNRPRQAECRTKNLAYDVRSPSYQDNQEGEGSHGEGDAQGEGMYLDPTEWTPEPGIRNTTRRRTSSMYKRLAVDSSSGQRVGVGVWRERVYASW